MAGKSRTARLQKIVDERLALMFEYAKVKECIMMNERVLMSKSAPHYIKLLELEKQFIEQFKEFDRKIAAIHEEKDARKKQSLHQWLKN